MPAAIGYIFFQPLKPVGIVLLGPGILDGTFKIEDVVGICLQQAEILIQRIEKKLIDRTLHIPTPLRIEMGI